MYDTIMGWLILTPFLCLIVGFWWGCALLVARSFKKLCSGPKQEPPQEPFRVQARVVPEGDGRPMQREHRGGGSTR